MIKRYEVSEITAIWSDENKFSIWLKIEKLLLQFLVQYNDLSEEDYLVLDKEMKFDLNQIYETEAKLKHDVFAFINVISNSTNHPAKKWIHYGLTSTDVVDTANAVLVMQTNKYLLKKIEALMETLKSTAYKYQHLPQIGRTHGIHAEITSFGLKFALYYDEFQRHLDRFNLAREEIEVGKISGAVGTCANTGVCLQDFICHRLRIHSARISTQIISRDNHAFYFNILNLIGLTLNKIATELRHLARTEVNEVNEFFDSEQVGSSAMPHKKNPVGLENICGLTRLLNGYALVANENVNLWHERDISHSSNERVLFLDATSVLAYTLNRLNEILKVMIVNSAVLAKNIALTANAIFSQTVMLKLINQVNLTRQEIYGLLKKAVEDAQKNQTSFEAELIKSEIAKHLSPEEIAAIFNQTYHLKFVDKIYERVFKKNKF